MLRSLDTSETSRSESVRGNHFSTLALNLSNLPLVGQRQIFSVTAPPFPYTQMSLISIFTTATPYVPLQLVPPVMRVRSGRCVSASLFYFFRWYLARASAHCLALCSSSAQYRSDLALRKLSSVAFLWCHNLRLLSSRRHCRSFVFNIMQADMP